MAALTTKVLSNDGSAPTLAAANATDTAQVGNGLNTFLVYRNTGSTGPATATITPPGKTSYGVNLPPKVVTVPGASERWIPLRRDYADETGRATIATSIAGPGVLATDVKVAVVRVG